MRVHFPQNLPIHFRLQNEHSKRAHPSNIKANVATRTPCLAPARNLTALLWWEGYVAARAAPFDQPWMQPPAKDCSWGDRKAQTHGYALLALLHEDSGGSNQFRSGGGCTQYDV